MEGDFGVRAQAIKDRSVGCDYEGSVRIADMFIRLEQGFETLVPAQVLRDEAKRHALTYMRHGQLVSNLEYMRQDRLLPVDR